MRVLFLFIDDLILPSMKVPPKRKGNNAIMLNDCLAQLPQ